MEEDEERDIVLAANSRDLKQVIALIAEGADVNARDNDTETVLMWAAGRGRTEPIKRLLDAGADVNARSNLNGTALSWAVRYAPVETVRVLLDAGADVNAGGARALYGAIYRRHPEIVALLIERGANMTVHDEPNGETPLSLAKKRGNVDVIRLLKAAGATE